MRFIDLFAGIGGFHYGIQRAWSQSGQNGKEKCLSPEKDCGDTQTALGKSAGLHCVYSNEYDKYAASVYKKHFKKCDTRDIRAVDVGEIPDHDLLCGGFPCQAFSIAGKRRGFDDTRGTLFFEIARILRAKRPRLFLLENVKGLLSHDNGNTIKIILITIAELGYDCQWQVLNSKDFGVPQNRERIFIVGHLRGTPRPQVFPIGASYQKPNSEKREGERKGVWLANAIDTNYGKGADGKRTLIKRLDKDAPHYQDRFYGTDGISPALPTGATGGNLLPKIVAQPLRFLNRNQKNFDNVAMTVDTNNSTGIRYGTAIRRLTPIECERLQGFPDNWTKYGENGELISDTQRYKMCGNAVTTTVITEIAKRLI